MKFVDMQLYSNKLTFDVIIFTQLVVLRNTCMVFVLIQLASCNANFSMLVGFLLSW